jgi:hypothetical protein
MLTQGFDPVFAQKGLLFLPRSKQAVRQFGNSLMVEYTTKHMQKESN